MQDFACNFSVPFTRILLHPDYDHAVSGAQHLLFRRRSEISGWPAGQSVTGMEKPKEEENLHSGVSDKIGDPGIAVLTFRGGFKISVPAAVVIIAFPVSGYV